MSLSAKLTDHAQALEDAMLLRAGALRPSASLHPIAEELVAQGSNLFRAFVEAYGTAAARPGITSPKALFSAGLQSSDFGNAVAGALQRVAMIKLTAQTSHRAICAPVDARNFNPVEYASTDIDLELLERESQSEYGAPINVFAEPGVVAAPRHFGRNLFISRETVINDDFGLLAGIVGNFGVAAGRLEAKLLANALESNPNLGDGMPLFNAGFGNVVPSALDAASLSAAVGQLRTVKTPAGALSNLAAAFLVVAPELEVTANTLITTAGMRDQIRVVSLAWLPEGRWYVMSSPDQAAVMGLIDVGGGSFRIGNIQGSKERDGVLLGVRFNPQVVPLGRIGAVRGGV